MATTVRSKRHLPLSCSRADSTGKLRQLRKFRFLAGNHEFRHCAPYFCKVETAGIIAIGIRCRNFEIGRSLSMRTKSDGFDNPSVECLLKTSVKRPPICSRDVSAPVLHAECQFGGAAAYQQFSTRRRSQECCRQDRERTACGEANVPLGLRFEAISMSLAAAIEGVGVALGRSLLVQDAIADNRLCRVFPSEWDMPSSKVHVIRWASVLSGDTRVGRFLEWISSEIGPD
jgi:hypothetical protein